MISALKQRALHRAKIIEGQMRGVQQMIDDEAHCMDILTQSLAIQKSISSLNKLLVEDYIRTYARQGLSSTESSEQEKAAEELLALYELTNIRGK